MTLIARRTAAAALAATILFVPVACSDEDGDGATTDEEVDQIDEQLEDTGDQLQQEVDKGGDEIDDNNND